MFQDKRKLKELLLAILLVGISGFVLYFSVLELNKKKEHYSLFSLEKVIYHYCLTYKTIPLASLNITLLSDEFDSIIFKGFLASSQSSTPSEFSGQLSFNSLGQLYSGSAHLPLKEYQIDTSLTGALNALIQVSVTKDTQQIIQKEFSIPGPVLIREKPSAGEGISVSLPSENMNSNTFFEQGIYSIEQIKEMNKAATQTFSVTESESNNSCNLQNLPEELAVYETQIVENIKRLSGLR